MSKTSKHPIRSLVINGVLVLLAFGLLGGVVWDKRKEISEILHRDLDYRLIALAFTRNIGGAVCGAVGVALISFELALSPVALTAETT